MDGTPVTEIESNAAVQLSCHGLGVSFGSARALSDFNLDVKPGEIVALLGHNGAGKSTFVGAVTGANPGYTGTISVGGEVVSQGVGPREVAELGVSVLYQEPALVASLNVRDNLFLGHHVKPSDDLADSVLTQVGGDLGLDRPVSTLSLGQRQLVGLARSLLSGQPKVVLLDEPTAALGRDETHSLHELIKEFASRGTSIVYISHRLRDIYDVCTRIVVLREGRKELDLPIVDISLKQLTGALAPGLETEEEIGEAVVNRGPVVASLETPLGEIEARQGEIVGLFGMAAGPQFEAIEHAYGLRGPASYRLLGETIQVSCPQDAIKRQVHLIPADREVDGLVHGLSAIDNVFLPWMHKRKFASAPSRQALYRDVRHLLGIQGPGGGASIAAFSGGNRQKHLIARWTIPVSPRLLLLSQPTQGVDVQAKRDIRAAVEALAAEGTSVFLASAEADEIAAMCTRAYVFAATGCHEVAGGPDFDARLVSALLEDRPTGV